MPFFRRFFFLIMRRQVWCLSSSKWLLLFYKPAPKKWLLKHRSITRVHLYIGSNYPITKKLLFHIALETVEYLPQELQWNGFIEWRILPKFIGNVTSGDNGNGPARGFPNHNFVFPMDKIKCTQGNHLYPLSLKFPIPQQ